MDKLPRLGGRFYDGRGGQDSPFTRPTHVGVGSGHPPRSPYGRCSNASLDSQTPSLPPATSPSASSPGGRRAGSGGALRPSPVNTKRQDDDDGEYMVGPKYGGTSLVVRRRSAPKLPAMSPIARPRGDPDGDLGPSVVDPRAGRPPAREDGGLTGETTGDNLGGAYFFGSIPDPDPLDVYGMPKRKSSPSRKLRLTDVVSHAGTRDAEAAVADTVDVLRGPDFDFPPPSPGRPGTRASVRPDTRASTRRRRGRVKVSPRTPYAPVYRDKVWGATHWDAVTTMEDDVLLSCGVEVHGKYVTGRRDGTLSVWVPSTATRHTVCTPGHDGPVKFVFTVRDGRAVVSIGGTTLKVWDPNTWWCMATEDIAKRPDTTPPYLPSVTSLEGLASEAVMPKETPTTTAGARAKAADGDAAASPAEVDQLGHPVTADTKAQLVAETRTVLAAAMEKQSVEELPSGVMAELGESPSMRLWDGADSPLPPEAAGADAPLDATGLDGRTSSSVLVRRELDFDGINCAIVVEVHGEFNIDGHHVLCGYGDGSLQLFSVFDWKFVERIPRAHDAPVTAMLQLADGTLVTGAMDGRIKVWTRQHFGSFTCRRTVLAHTQGVACLVLCKGRVISSCNDATIKTWNVDTWVREKTMASMTRFVFVMATNYMFFVSGGSDGMFNVWDQVTAESIGKYVAHIGCHVANLFVSRGSLVSVGSDDYKIKAHDFTPWLISAIDCVDMFRVWHILTGPSSNPDKANAAMRNLIVHYDGKETAFVEHVLFLGFVMSADNIDLMRQADAHRRFAFFAYLDHDQDGVVSDTDLVHSLNIPLPAAQFLLCQTVGQPPPHPNTRTPYTGPYLTAEGLYPLLQSAPVGLKRLIASAGAHWMYYGARKRGQSFRFFGLSTLAPLINPYLTLKETLAIAVLNHDCNAVSHLGIFWKTLSIPPRTVHMGRIQSFSRRLAYGRALEGGLASGREMCPFYCVRDLRLVDVDIDDGDLVVLLRVMPLLQSLNLNHRAKLPPARLSTTPHITDATLLQLWRVVPHLTALRLFNTPGVSYLPSELVKLKQLREVTVNPGEVHTPPPEITADGYGSIFPYLHDMKASGVVHWPYFKLVMSGDGKEGVASAIDAMRHAYYWPFGGLPGRHASDRSLLGSILPCKYPGPTGVVQRLQTDYERRQRGLGPVVDPASVPTVEDSGRIHFPNKSVVDFELFVRDTCGEAAFARTIGRKLPAHRAVYVCVINLADWAGDIRDRMVRNMKAIHEVAENAQVVVLGTGADQVLTPQDTPGCTLTVDQRMEEALRMVQVWDKMNYYFLQDTQAVLKKKFKQRLADVFSTSDPYEHFDITGRYTSKTIRPDRPWERPKLEASRYDSDSDAESVWEPETVDEIRGELEAADASMNTRPRVVGAIALGCFNGVASLYRLHPKFHLDDPDPTEAEKNDPSGGPWIPVGPPPPPSEQKFEEDGDSGSDDGREVEQSQPVTGVRRFAPTEGVGAAMSELHRLITKSLPTCVNLVSNEWLQLTQAVCMGKVAAPRVLTPPPTPEPPRIINPKQYNTPEEAQYVAAKTAMAWNRFKAWFDSEVPFQTDPDEAEGEDAPLVPPMVSYQHFRQALTDVTDGRMSHALFHLKFAAFLHNVGLCVWYEQEVHCGPDHKQKVSPFAGRAKPMQTLGPLLQNQDGTTRTIPVTGVLDNTVWLQPQYLFHALTRAMYPEVRYLRFGRRFGDDPKENLLTYDAAAEATKAATLAATPKAEVRMAQFAVCLAQASVSVSLDRYYELLRSDLLYSGRGSLKIRVLSYHRKLPPTPSSLIPEAPDEADIRGVIPKTGVRITADMRTLSTLDKPWEAPKSFTPSKGFVKEAEEDDLLEGILFHVHVQLRDKYGRPYFNWVVFRTHRDFFKLHTQHFEAVQPPPPELPERPGKFTRDRLKAPLPSFVDTQLRELDDYMIQVTNAGPALSRHDALLRMLDLHKAICQIVNNDRGMGDGTKRAALLSAHRINGGEGPAGDGGGGVDVIKELERDGIALTSAEDALDHDPEAMKADAAKAEADAKLAELTRGDQSPRPNNLDFHGGFERVNGNALLRTLGASTGADRSPSPPKLLDGVVNYYHTIRGSRMLRAHMEEHQERNKLRLYYLYHRLWRHFPKPLVEDLFARLYHTGGLVQWPDETPKVADKPAEGPSKAQLEMMELKRLKKKGEPAAPMGFTGASTGNNPLELGFRVVNLADKPIE